jgi:hypothetical protein
MVVSYEDAMFQSETSFLGSVVIENGIEIVTPLPRPGLESTSNVPPY